MHASFFSRAMMHRAIGSGGAARLVLLPSYVPPRVGRGRGACGVRFRRSEPENQENMEAKIKTEKKEKIRDGMSASFGTAYATRSEEEGFGGIYGGNQTFGENDDEGAPQGNRYDYESTQGSDVKEKEKGRHQKENAP